MWLIILNLAISFRAVKATGHPTGPNPSAAQSNHSGGSVGGFSPPKPEPLDPTLITTKSGDNLAEIH